jgi:signal transduction histidine kinase
MVTTRQPSPLAVAALAFIEDHVTPAELATRFAAVHASVDEPNARELLDELSELGLARPVSEPDGTHQFFPTPLGQRLLGVSFVGRREHADLLAELEQMRTELVSTIAHELRTPLTAVRTSIGLLLDAKVDPTVEQRRTLLETIDRNAMRMQRVVGDILDLARFRAGTVQLQLRRFDAVELARSAIASVAPLAATRQQEIELAAPDASVWMFGDYRRLEQALVNLLSNAEKYSTQGARIDVTVRERDGEVSWAVRDRGSGIEPADQARLFERFFVAHRDRAESAAGVGLGLPITLAIVEAHEGRIDVESTPNRGSTFTITVPAAGPGKAPAE